MSSLRDRRRSEEEHINETWLIPYSDLLTLLLALFIVLFAASKIDADKLEKLGRSMHGAFTGGNGFFQFFGMVEPLEEPLAQTTPGRTVNMANSSDHVSDEMRPTSTAPSSESRSVSPEDAELANKALESHRKLESLKGKLDAYIVQNDLAEQLETELSGNMLLITIRDHALFDSGSIQIKEGARKLAVEIANLLSQYDGYDVTVAGHTDNVPITSGRYDSNWELSTLRALEFMKVLFENPDLDQRRFSAIGYGEYRPIASNDTPEGRARNRRVEVTIYDPNFLSKQETLQVQS